MVCKEAVESVEWQSVQQLSGGQQAIAALALTLAISVVFPCPFVSSQFFGGGCLPSCLRDILLRSTLWTRSMPVWT